MTDTNPIERVPHDLLVPAIRDVEPIGVSGEDHSHFPR